MRIKSDYVGDGVSFMEVYCTSDDSKPVTGVATGSVAIEVDTGKVFFFNEDGTTGNEWVEQFSFQPGS